MEELYDFENSKIIGLEVKLTDGTVLKECGNQIFFQVESIESQIRDKHDIIHFGYIGVKRELIEWFRFFDVKMPLVVNQKFDLNEENIDLLSKQVKHAGVVNARY